MRMMVKALLFDSAREIEKLQALQIDWAGCGVSELCATSDFAEAYRLTMENKVHIIFCNWLPFYRPFSFASQTFVCFA